MSLINNKSSFFFNKQKEIIENQKILKTNRNNVRSLKHTKMHIFSNDSNKNFLYFLKAKSNIFPKVSSESIKDKKTKKIKKTFELKNYLINKNIITPTTPFLNLKIVKKTRNNNIYTMNHFKSEKEKEKEKNDITYFKSRRNIFSAKYKYKNIKNCFTKNISNIDKYSSRGFSSYISKDNIINNKIFGYNNIDEKKRMLIRGYKQKTQKSIKVFINEKKFNTLDETLKKSKTSYINNFNKKYHSRIKEYYSTTIPGCDIFGNIKPNQDSNLSLLNIYNLNNYSVFGVFDGHGINGHLVSKFTKNYFKNFFENISNNNINENIIYKELKKEEIIKKKIRLIEDCLLEQNYSIQYSGTTCVIVIHIEDKIICYNIGDSRAVYINKDFKCIEITKDHKPEIPKEKIRIEENGGIVKRDFLKQGIYRVWSKNGNYPGLAMSRSIGDYVSKGLGVIDEPDIYEINLIEKNVYAVILGSDGLWDILNYYQIEKIVKEYIIKNDCIGCTNALIEESKKIYDIKNITRDDITIITIFFN